LRPTRRRPCRPTTSSRSTEDPRLSTSSEPDPCARWGFCYFYGDERYQFFFYADPERGPDGLIYTVNDATTGRLEGIAPKIAEADLPAIEHNITRLFLERDSAFPAEPVREEHRPARVVFTWETYLSQRRARVDVP
jgi:hypothetical protein